VDPPLPKPVPQQQKFPLAVIFFIVALSVALALFVFLCIREQRNIREIEEALEHESQTEITNQQYVRSSLILEQDQPDKPPHKKSFGRNYLPTINETGEDSTLSFGESHLSERE
jgi:hypothetical protein